MEEERFVIAKYWGRLIALPCALLVFGASVSGLNLSATSLGLEANVIGLISVVVTTIVVTWKYSKGQEKLFRIVFILSVVLMQAFLGSAMHDWMVMEDMIERSNDFSFVVIIPCLLVAAQLWGWIFDLMRIRAARLSSSV